MKVKVRESVRCLVVFCCLLFAKPANAIQILEETVTDAMGVVSHTLTIGITQLQLDFGLIDGFFLNLLFFAATGDPPPNIVEYEMSLAGSPAIDPDGESARWVFDATISEPMIVMANVDIEYDPSVAGGTEAIYGLSSLDANLDPIETVTFESAAPMPEPATYVLVVMGLIGLAWARIREPPRASVTLRRAGFGVKGESHRLGGRFDCPLGTVGVK